jgi:hypothetical protein
MSSPESWDWSLRIFDHVDVHASDYAESIRFYETVLAPLGIQKLAEGDDWTCFVNLNVADRQPPTQNLHLCFFTREREHVDAFHRAEVEAGFRSNSEPGYRDYGPATTRPTCSTRMATTSRRSTAMSGTSATVRARCCVERRLTRPRA